MDGQTLTANDLLREIFLLEKAVLSLKTKVLKALPVKYGSEAWWEKLDQEGLEQIKRGEVIKFENTKELKKSLGL